MSVEETVQTLHSIENRAGDFPNMTDCDWVAIAAAKRHLSTLKTNENSVYTKQELRDMGFGFDLNGNIVTPQEIEESAARHIRFLQNPRLLMNRGNENDNVCRQLVRLFWIQ